MRRSLLVIFFPALFFPGCAVVSDVNIGEGASTTRKLSTVVGDVHVGDGATIRKAKTVAGDIRIENGATTGDLETTAGDIRISQNVTVKGSIESTAGNISIREGSRITGNINHTAGNIDLRGCTVEGSITLTTGKLNVLASQVIGGVLIPKLPPNHNRESTTVTIGPGSNVASVTVEERDKVSILISRDATVGNISGIIPEYY